jgi:sugar phosphate isomerase/epimerase
MTVALPELGLGTAHFLQLTLPAFIDVADRAGFHRMSARPYAFAQALADGWTEADLKRRLDDAGIAVTMIDGLADAFPGTLDRADADVRSRLPADVLDPPDEAMVFRAATALGASVVNVGHYLGASLPVEVLADALGGVCRRAAEHGLRLCLEFFPDSGLPDLPFAQRVVEACGEPNVGVLLDVFHLDRSGGTVEDVRRLPPGAIPGIQISDRKRPPPGTPHVAMSGRLMPGEGELPLRQLVEAALENSPDATIDLEVLNDELRGLPPDEAAARLAAAAARLTRWNEPPTDSRRSAEK